MTPPPSPTFRVALCQFKPKPLDPAANFAYASKLIRDAASQGASLAVLFEYHLTGWEPKSPAFAEIAQTSAHKYQKKYQELAKELGINIVPGTIVQTPSPDIIPDKSNGADQGDTDKDGPALLNIAPFISYTGELLGTYTKTNLWHPERPHLTSSVEHSLADDEQLPELHGVIETPLGPVGILVCWDLAFPEAFRALISAGAKIIIIPTFWTAFDMAPEGLAYNKDAEKLFLQTTLIARAYENTACIIFCNAAGPAEEGYLGLSQVAMPLVGAVKPSFTDGEEGVRVVDVDMNIVEVAEANYKVRQDMQSEKWHYGYSLK